MSEASSHLAPLGPQNPPTIQFTQTRRWSSPRTVKQTSPVAHPRLTARLPHELYETILSHLDERDNIDVLPTLLRTCHAWRFEALRILYRTVRLTGMIATDQTDLDYTHWRLLFANGNRDADGGLPRTRPIVNPDAIAARMIYSLTIDFPPLGDDPCFPAFVTSLLLQACNLKDLKLCTKELKGDNSFLIPASPSPLPQFPFRLRGLDTDMAGDDHALCFLLNQDGSALTDLSWIPHSVVPFCADLFAQKGIGGIPPEGLGHLFPSLHTIACDSLASVLCFIFEPSIKRIKINSLESFRVQANKRRMHLVEMLQLADMERFADVQDTFPNLQTLVLGVARVADIYTSKPCPLLRRAHVFLDDLSLVDYAAVHDLSRHMFNLHFDLEVVVLFSPYHGWEMRRATGIGAKGAGYSEGNGVGYNIRTLTDKVEEAYNWISFFDI